MQQIYDEDAPKKATNLSVNSDLLKKARSLRINLSATFEHALALRVKTSAREAWLKENKGVLPIYVASSNEGISLSKVKAPERFCLVLGSESHGVSEQIIRLADKNIRVEITGDIESLNVSSAAAILLYGLR